MLTQEIIRKKRDKGALTKAEIDVFIRGVADQSVGEGQVASFCMAVLLNKMNRDERVALTMAMAQSGRTLAWDDLTLNGPVLDKHSTGGIGDKTSLMLAPLIAACGGYVPMISGRGLGHTGGTLDKMDAIPGYVSQPNTTLLRQVVRDVGCAIVGATSDIAPADRTMYAVRDVTATVESLDLITASILSKKLAAGLQGLVMDVKFGSGAFMRDYDDARALAESIAGVANGAGLPCVALMTDMDQCLGRTAGNAVEVREAIEFLRGEKIERRLYDVTMALVAELLVIGRLAPDAKTAHEMADRQLRNGRAAEIFESMVAALGGPADILAQTDKYLPLAPVTRPLMADKAGILQSVDARQLGLAIIELGGGRRLVSDKIDHSVGLAQVAPLGAVVGPGAAPLMIIHARDQATAAKAEAIIQAAYVIVAPGTKIADAPALRQKITG